MRELDLKKLLTVVLSLLGLVAFFASFSIISPGNVGIVFNRLTGNLSTSGQGIVWRVPFITMVQSYPVALRTYTMVARTDEGSSGTDDSMDLPSNEGQHVHQDLSVTYNTSEEQAALVFRSFRGADIQDIESTFVRRTIITVAQNVAGQMALSDLISGKRTQLQESISTSLSVELAKMGFRLDKVNLGASHLPQAIEKQMQDKMAVQQQALQAQYELQKQETLAKAAIAKARGEAEANHILQSSLSDAIIRYEATRRWNGELPQVVGGATPFFNLNDLHK